MRSTCGKPIEQRYTCSTSGEADTSGNDIFCGRLGSGLSVSPVFSGSPENLPSSGAQMAVPSSTAKNSALQRPRILPLKASGSRRLAGAAPRRILRYVHTGSETVSPRWPKPPLLTYETTRYEGDNPGSCFVAVTARTTAWAGGRRDPTPPRGVNELWRSPC